MAQHRSTLALILILTILSSVITAFRLRDLPKTSKESTKKTDVNKQKCDSCDVSEKKLDFNLDNIKIESAKRSYDHLKKVVREKQQLISQNKNDVKPPAFKFDFDDDDDDDEDDSLDNESGEQLKLAKSDRSSFEVKIEEKSINILSSEDKGENEENEGDDDDDDVKQIPIKQKVETKEQQLKTTVKIKDRLYDKHGDDDDDDDDDNDVKQIPIKQKVESKQPQLKKTEKTKVSLYYIHEDDDDDEDDDDNDEHLKSSKESKGPENKEDTSRSETVTKTLTSKPVSIQSKTSSENKYTEKKSSKENQSKVKVIKGDKFYSAEIKSEHTSPSKKIEIKDVKGPKTPTTVVQPTENKIFDDNKQPEVVRNKVLIEKDGRKSVSSSTSDSSTQNTEKLPKLPKKPDSNKEVEHIKSKTINVEPKKEVLKEKIHEVHVPKTIKKENTKDNSKPKDDEQEKSPKPKPNTAKRVSKPEEIYKTEKKIDSKSKTEDGFISKSDAQKKSSKESFEITEEKLESPLNSMTDSLQRRNLLKSEFEDFYSFLPTFAPNFSRIHNQECRRHGQILLRQLRGTKLWALNMLDATAKIPSGILQGNGIQLGDFDQCLGSRARVQLDTGSVVKVQGKYCLARFDLKAEHHELEVPVHLAQAKNLIKSRIDDPGHFAPRFSTLSWGVCVPSACEPDDVEVILKDALKHYQHTSGLSIRVKVDEDDCRTQDETEHWDDWFELPTVLTLSFYGLIVMLVFTATIQDMLGRNSEESGDDADDKAECDQKDADGDKWKEKITKHSDGVLSSFSIFHTFNKLLAPAHADEISCIHGVRGLVTIILLIVHKFVLVSVMPYTNRLKITESLSSPLFSWARAGWAFTDCFLLLSGTLTSHRVSADSSVIGRVLFRYIRLTPALLAVVLFYAYVWDIISSGPMWGSLVTKNSELCQESWWWNLLYIQNYFNMEDMCAPHTHQLALDMQLTAIGGGIVWLSQLKPGVTNLLLLGLHSIAAYSRYSRFHEHRLTLLTYHGVSVSQLYRTARLSYLSTLHRSTPYLIGLSLGIALKKPTRHHKIILALGWVSCCILWGSVLWSGWDSGSTQYTYNVSRAAIYAALAPIASSLATAWLIYAVYNGSGYFLSRFLCWAPLVLVSRLSYALYLCQFIIFITTAATVKHSSDFSWMSWIDLQEIVLLLMTSIILTVTFIIPMQSMHKMFLFSKTSTQVSDQEEDTTKDKLEPIIEENETEIEMQWKNGDVKKVLEVSTNKKNQNLLIHREPLDEDPEIDIEYEMLRQRNDNLEEIMEEEEDELGEDEMQDRDIMEEEPEIVEEGGEQDFWERESYRRRRPYELEDDHDVEEWEWTANGNGRNGAQYYRHNK